MSAIPIDEGFQMSYVTAEPGNGPMLHNHDTNETFVAIKGRWRVIWGANEEHSDRPRSAGRVLGAALSCRGASSMSRLPRTVRPGLLLTIQPGNAPNVEFL